MSKAARARYTEALRHEVWHLGVVVCLVEPGAVATNVLDAATATGGAIADYDRPREAARRTLLRGFRRAADPAEIATLIADIADIADIVGTSGQRHRYGAGRDGR
ncbi:hypothetical protein SAMN05421810_108214 [Amycolatopsis arida]|uniref:Uncharacterized protein n=1 Tax=Amycolatopsis arida TaxID=587909 RepID=A0A1I5Z592_9PSEU|nr:hypothetical protein [Amycolatopsis arida]TDX90125.1 hypothetical protein CLV69_108214 [Amycolatopsis arida]SFQ51267.1 hypothetical protein SAMN05421810_108214 [Amycolatopsis arida]